jgi:peptide deformylase
MASFEIRIVGDPVLKQRAHEIENVDDALVRLVDDMVVTMYEAPGVGLAAPQVGVQKRLFVYDIGEGAQTLVNPTIVEGDGEWVFDEGCLSVPGLSWEIVRPKEVHLTGWDL